jgi:hypothetical protein
VDSDVVEHGRRGYPRDPLDPAAGGRRQPGRTEPTAS